MSPPCASLYRREPQSTANRRGAEYLLVCVCFSPERQELGRFDPGDHSKTEYSEAEEMCDMKSKFHRNSEKSEQN